MSTIPTSTAVGSLLDALEAKLEAITTIDEVIIGEFSPVALQQKTSGQFPCAAIMFNGMTGQANIDGRNIRRDVSFRIKGYTYAAVADRLDGDDMLACAAFAEACLTQVYAFHDDASNPCTGFLMVNPEFNLQCEYKAYSEHVNEAVIDVSLKIDLADTSA